MGHKMDCHYVGISIYCLSSVLYIYDIFLCTAQPPNVLMVRYGGNTRVQHIRTTAPTKYTRRALAHFIIIIVIIITNAYKRRRTSSSLQNHQTTSERNLFISLIFTSISHILLLLSSGGGTLVGMFHSQKCQKSLIYEQSM